MNCLEADLLMQRYYDAELSPAKSALVSRHLLRCPSCSQEFDKVKREMRDLITDVVEPQVNLEGLRAAVAREIEGLRPRHPIPLAPVSIAGSLVLAAGLALSLFGGVARFPGPTRPLPSAPGDACSYQLPGGGELRVEGGGGFQEGEPPRLLSGSALLQLPPRTQPFILETSLGGLESRGGEIRLDLYAPEELPTLLRGWLAENARSPAVAVVVLRGEATLRGTLTSHHLRAGEAGVFTAEQLGPGLSGGEAAQPVPAAAQRTDPR